MTVYVDNFKGKFRNMIMSHMTADNIEELHAFAKKIGLKREWFQEKSIPHYDISQSKREEAIRMGAIEETCRETIIRVHDYIRINRNFTDLGTTDVEM